MVVIWLLQAHAYLLSRQDRLLSRMDCYIADFDQPY